MCVYLFDISLDFLTCISLDFYAFIRRDYDICIKGFIINLMMMKWCS